MIYIASMQIFYYKYYKLMNIDATQDNIKEGNFQHLCFTWLQITTHNLKGKQIMQS